MEVMKFGIGGSVNHGYVKLMKHLDLVLDKHLILAQPDPRPDGPSPDPRPDGPSPSPRPDGPSPDPRPDGPSPIPRPDGPSPDPRSDGPSHGPTPNPPSRPQSPRTANVPSDILLARMRVQVSRAFIHDGQRLPGTLIIQLQEDERTLENYRARRQ